MNIRTRKFIGTVLLVLLLVVYALVAMAFGANMIVGKPAYVQVIYFLVAGVAWLLPAGWLIRWMQKPDETG